MMPRFGFGSDLVQLVHGREDKVQNLLISHEGADKSELSSIMQELKLRTHLSLISQLQLLLWLCRESVKQMKTRWR